MPPLITSLHIGSIHHKGGGIGQLGQKIGLGCIYSYLKGVIINHSDAANFRSLTRQHLLYPNNITKIRGGCLRPGLRGAGSLPGIFKLFSLNLPPIVKPDIMSQIKGVGLTIITNLPPLGDIWCRLKVVIKAD
ncbi:hypothetical protein ES703_106645 [subsurface metagenome]